MSQANLDPSHVAAPEGSVTTTAKTEIRIDEVTQSITIQDTHGNRIEMGAFGFRIISAKDLVFAAAGSIQMHAKDDLTCQAAGNLRHTAFNIEQLANANFTAKGSASAELSASGQTIVKGAMVLIN